MPTAGDHVPHALANGDGLAILYAAVAVGQFVNVLAKVAKAQPVGLDGRGYPARALVKTCALRRCLSACVRHHDAAVQVFQARHPQARVKLAREPTRHANVVGVHVGHQHAGHRPVVGGLREEFAPDFGVVIGAGAGVNNRPAIVVFQRPQVDVVQRIGQRHANPVDTRLHLQRVAAGRGCGKGVDQFARGLVVGQSVHGVVWGC